MRPRVLGALMGGFVCLLAFGAIATTSGSNVSGFSLLNVLADVVHGTATADKAVILDSNKALDVVRTASLRIGTSGSETTVSATGTELNYIAGVTPGTTAASKALIVDANKRLDDLDVTALEIGNVDVTATATEINNALDVSAQLQAITAAGAVTVDGTVRRATLSGGAYAITLAAPDAAAIGAVLVIEYAGGDTDAVTLALTNVIGESGGTTATFNADGEGLVLIGTALGWVVLSEFGGVTLA